MTNQYLNQEERSVKIKEVELLFNLSKENIKKEEQDLLVKYNVKSVRHLTKEQKSELTINKSIKNLWELCQAYQHLDDIGEIAEGKTDNYPDNLFFFAWKFKVVITKKKTETNMVKKFFQGKLSNFYDNELLAESIRILYGKEINKSQSKINTIDNTKITLDLAKDLKLNVEQCRELHKNNIVDFRFFELKNLEEIVDIKTLYEEFNDKEVEILNKAFLKKEDVKESLEEIVRKYREKYLESELLKNDDVKKEEKIKRKI